MPRHVVHCACGETQVIYSATEHSLTAACIEFRQRHQGPRCEPCDATAARKARKEREVAGE